MLYGLFKRRKTKASYCHIQYSKTACQKQNQFSMTKIIEFNHRGEKIRSVAIFNFEHAECSVMVMPYIHKDELGNTIVITRKDHDWISEAPIASEYRLTYLNILNELDLLVIENDTLKNLLSASILN